MWDHESQYQHDHGNLLGAVTHSINIIQSVYQTSMGGVGHGLVVKGLTCLLLGGPPHRKFSNIGCFLLQSRYPSALFSDLLM